MEYNPYAASYTALKHTLLSADNENNKWLEQLDWYDSFDGKKASTALSKAVREMNSLEKELEGIIEKLVAQRLRVSDLKPETRLGLDPRYWFSTERSVKKREFSTLKQVLAQLIGQQDELQQAMRIKNEQVGKQKTESERYRCFDRLEAEAAVKALNTQMLYLRPELEQLRSRKDRVDHQLKEPLAELMGLNRRKHGLELEITRAKTFEQRLSSASNSYERKMIHDDCGATLGESQPARIISAKQRELQSINRNIGKLQDRLRSITQRASRIIKTIVIDGNNLCYQYQTFIGVVALQAVAQTLSIEYSVVIVFDASIRRLLQSSDRDIAARFGNSIKVHVVASRQKADETLLDAAIDSNAYVISNDRFGDFPDKAAVLERRLITHEILNGKVFIHDLSVSEDIAAIAN